MRFYYVPKTLQTLLWCDGKNLGLMPRTWFSLWGLNFYVSGKTHTSFPSFCFLIYKVGENDTKRIWPETRHKKILKPYDTILPLKVILPLPSWHLHTLFAIQIPCKDTFSLFHISHCIFYCMCVFAYVCICVFVCGIYTYTNACAYTHMYMHVHMCTHTTSFF